MNIGTALSDIICYPLGAIMKVFYLFTPNYALLLLLFTIVVRIALFPLAIKQQKSSAEMLRMKPKMDKLQKKYAKDKQKMQEEMSKLYSEEGYNPMSGCLPLLVQMPILFGLYQVVYNPLKYLMWYSQGTIDKIGDALRTYVIGNMGLKNLNDPQVQLYLTKAMRERPDLVSFLGTPKTVDFSVFGIDLSAIPHWGFNLLVLIPILVYLSQAASSYLSFKMNQQIQSTQPGGKFQNIMMTFLLPLMSVWFSLTLPASIGFYWIITNLLMCVQVIILNKYFSLDRMAAKATAEAEKRKEEIRSGKRKPSRMQQMAQQALEMQKSQQSTGSNVAPLKKPSEDDSDIKENSVKLNSKGKKSRSQIKEEQRRRLAKARQNGQDN